MRRCDYKASYDHPDEVLVDPRWSDAEKREILTEWRLAAMRKVDSADEGLQRDGEEGRSFLGAVERALRTLDEREPGLHA